MRDESRAKGTPHDAPVAAPSQELAARGHASSLPCLTITEAERAQLVRWTNARTSPHRLVVRSRIILLASDGLPTGVIAERLGISPATVRLWCRRFHRSGLAALPNDAPGRGRRPGMSRDVVTAVLHAMRDRPHSAPRWTARSLASRAGTSASTVWRIWKHVGLNPASSRADIERAIAKLIPETPESRQ